jgi:hypothetical protein
MLKKVLKNKELPDEERRELQKKEKMFTKRLKRKHFIKMVKMTPDELRFRMKEYCNPGCLGTIFEKGKEFPISVKRKHKYNKSRMKEDIRRRKEIFGLKSNVLRSDDFYEKISEQIIQTKKKKGAISGCSSLLQYDGQY